MEVFADVFGSTTCAGCRALHPTIEKLVKLKTLSGCQFKDLDESKANEEEADKLGITALPTVFLYKVPSGRGKNKEEWKCIGSFTGNHGFKWVSDFINNCIAREEIGK